MHRGCNETTEGPQRRKTARGQVEPATKMALADLMPITLGAIDTLLMLSILGVGAAALGKRFRLYSLLTLATVVVFGALTFMYVPRVAAAEPTPWLGVVERIYLGAFLLWVAMLAVSLLRTAPRRAPNQLVRGIRSAPVSRRTHPARGAGPVRTCHEAPYC